MKWRNTFLKNCVHLSSIVSETWKETFNLLYICSRSGIMTGYMEQQVKWERGEGGSLKIDIWGKKWCWNSWITDQLIPYVYRTDIWRCLACLALQFAIWEINATECLQNWDGYVIMRDYYQLQMSSLMLKSDHFFFLRELYINIKINILVMAVVVPCTASVSLEKKKKKYNLCAKSSQLSKRGGDIWIIESSFICQCLCHSPIWNKWG